MKVVDCRNMSCPLPVVAVKRALADLPMGDVLQVLLDPGAPVENVTRFAVNRAYTVTEQSADGSIALVIAGRETGSGQETYGVPDGSGGSGVLLIAADRLGEGPEELGRLLMKNFIITLLDLAEPPDRMIFLNTGVMLTTTGSEVLEALEKLGNRGVEILSCGVCLDYFNRKDQLIAGKVTNMFTIAESVLKGGAVVRL
jgi:selenium metabolism protein YedF